MTTEAWWRDPDELDLDQQAVINLPLQGRYLVEGPPGSGKTNLMVLRARHLLLSDHPNIAVLTFTRTLMEFIKSGIPAKLRTRIDVKTINGFLQAQLFENMGEAGIRDLPTDFQDNRRRMAERLLQYFEANGNGHLFETLLVDEVQDCTPEEIKLFSKLSENLFFVGDSGQKIYASEDPFESLRAIVSKTISLRFHYRNGLEICRLADAVRGGSRKPMSPTCNYNESLFPSSVKVVEEDDVSAQIAEMIESVRNQLTAYRGHLIGVITPGNLHLDEVSHAIQTSFPDSSIVQRSGGVSAFEVGQRIVCCNAYNAKGLEFRCLHIIGADEWKGSQPRARFYTAITRAKTSLSLYRSSQFPGWIREALTQAKDEATPEVSLADLFGDGGDV